MPLVHLLGAVAGWVIHHPRALLGLLPVLGGLTAWGHTWQRAGHIERHWSWTLLFAVVLFVAYARCPKFRRAVHMVGLFVWCALARYSTWRGWFSRLTWAAVTYWAVLVHVARVYGWRGIVGGARLDWRTWGAFKDLRAHERATRSSVDTAHVEGGWVGKLGLPFTGAHRFFVRPAPGRSLDELVELARNGAFGSAWNFHARQLGLPAAQRFVVRHTGGPEGDGELLVLHDDPLAAEHQGPRIVTA